MGHLYKAGEKKAISGVAPGGSMGGTRGEVGRRGAYGGGGACTSHQACNTVHANVRESLATAATEGEGGKSEEARDEEKGEVADMCYAC